MIGEVLDFARMGSRKPQFSLVDLSSLVGTCVTSRRDAGDDVDMLESESIVLATDPQLASRAVENLIDNAVRYGGRTRVSVNKLADWAIIQIDDEGPGIPDDLLGKAMKPFERLDISRNREQGGTGLGLSIVGDIADVLGARFELSNRRRGLRAVLAFPVRRADSSLTS